MSNLEHYFENLLFDGKDCRGDVNKNSLTKEEQEAVEICAQYVIYSLFDNRDGFKEFIRQEFEPVKHGHWIDVEPAPFGDKYATCSECGVRQTLDKDNFCPNCGTRMDSGENG